MTIEILANANPSLDYLVYVFGENKPIPCPNSNLYPNNWDDEDILKLLGEEDFKKFEQGTYKFNTPAWKCHRLTNSTNISNAKNQRDQLLFISQWD